MAERNHSILLRNGTVLKHGMDEVVQVLLNTDILVVGQQIAAIGNNLCPNDASTVIIDCSNKIVSPGFIDAHHHVWQTQLKGRHGNHTLLDYIPSGNLQFHNYTPTDLFWGQLGGCLELLDGATTTVVDQAHAINSAEHTVATLAATIASGIRSIFCHGVPTMQVVEWDSNNFKVKPSLETPDWFLDQFETLLRQAPFGSDGQVQLGFYFESYLWPKETIQKLFSRIRSSGAKLITSHFRHFPLPTGQAKIPETLNELGLLGPDILLSHGNGTTTEQANMLRENGVHLTSTTDDEIFMASGEDPVAFRKDLQPYTCLGADCHTVGPGNMLHQMQVALAHSRAQQTKTAFSATRYPKQFDATVQSAFNLATIRGAKAVGMADRIGSISVGKLADLAVFDISTPSMTCAAQEDPLTAIVRHAGVREVDTVIVGGKIRKAGGILKEVKWLPSSQELGFMPEGLDPAQKALSWSDVSAQLLQSRLQVVARGSSQSLDVARTSLMRMLGIKEENFV